MGRYPLPSAPMIDEQHVARAQRTAPDVPHGASPGHCPQWARRM
jgi:hypothetical protein